MERKKISTSMRKEIIVKEQTGKQPLRWVHLGKKFISWLYMCAFFPFLTSKQMDGNEQTLA